MWNISSAPQGTGISNTKWAVLPPLIIFAATAEAVTDIKLLPQPLGSFVWR